MIILNIKPSDGAGQLRLGDGKSTVRNIMKVLGYPLCHEKETLDYFCDNSLQIEYENDSVRFIGISDHSEIECTYYGVDVFNCEARELFKLFASCESVEPSESPGETCFFPDQGLNLWEADEQYDRKGDYKRKVYAQIGIETTATRA